MLNVGRIVLPDVCGRLRHLDGLPLFVAGKHFGVFLVEHRRVDLIHRFGDFPAARPDIAQVHRIALLILAQRFAADIGAHAASQCVGDDQRRRGQPVGFHQWVYATFEVAVAGQDRRDGQIGFLNGFLDRLRQWPGVADAGGATVADQRKPELIKVLSQPGSFVVVGDHFRAGGQ